jgi:hypothetical protein
LFPRIFNPFILSPPLNTTYNRFTMNVDKGWL